MRIANSDFSNVRASTAKAEKISAHAPSQATDASDFQPGPSIERYHASTSPVTFVQAGTGEEIKASLDGLLSNNQIDRATHRLVLEKVQVLGFEDIGAIESHVRQSAIQLNRLSSVEKTALLLSSKQMVIVADDQKGIWDDARDGQIDGKSIQSQNQAFINENKNTKNPEIQARVRKAQETNDNLDAIFSMNNGFHSDDMIVVKASKVLSPDRDNGVVHPTLLHEVGHALVEMAAEQSPEFSATLSLDSDTHVQKNTHSNRHFIQNNSEYLAASFAKFRFEHEAPRSTQVLFDEMQTHLVRWVRAHKPATLRGVGAGGRPDDDNGV